MVFGLAVGHEDLASAQKAHAGGHPLDDAAAGLGVRVDGQHHQAGTQAHQHMHPQSVGLGHIAVMGPVQTHGKAAEHG